MIPFPEQFSHGARSVCVFTVESFHRPHPAGRRCHSPQSWVKFQSLIHFRRSCELWYGCCNDYCAQVVFRGETGKWFRLFREDPSLLVHHTDRFHQTTTSSPQSTLCRVWVGRFKVKNRWKFRCVKRSVFYKTAEIEPRKQFALRKTRTNDVGSGAE